MTNANQLKAGARTLCRFAEPTPHLDAGFCWVEAPGTIESVLRGSSSTRVRVRLDPGFSRRTVYAAPASLRPLA